ncbi:MAG: alpha-xylosidase, partial [Flavisolibacter sp.]
MKVRLLLLGFLFSACFNVLLADSPSYITTPDGVIIFTDPSITGATNVVKLEVIADNIIRVIAAPGKEIVPIQSLVTVYTKRADLLWNVVPSKQSLTLKTKALTAVVNLKTGAVSFSDVNGKKILGEKPAGGRSFQPAVFDGKRYYNVTQSFETTDGDAWYGLGQHQDGIMNYRGQQVSFFQNNTEIAIPFLISPKNYGILWDNYSLTKVGDVRPLHPLSSLQLFSKKGEEGWLTASYSNDKAKPETVVLERPETAINMEF